LKYRKKPVVIEAVQWTGSNVDEVLGIFLGSIEARRSDFRSHGRGDLPGGIIHIDTLEGTMNAIPGDWIIKGVKGEFYPCKPDIFEATYEPVLAA
jgi:hypothetical protein